MGREAVKVLDVWLALSTILAMGAFLLLGGPLWAAARAPVFRAGPQAPGWLALATLWLSRVVGGAMIVLALVLAGAVLWVPA